MKADWIIRIEMSRFFDRKAELRARTKRGFLGDTIYRAVFAATLRDEFTDSEIRRARSLDLISPEQIHKDGQIRTVYCWLENPCQYQPVWYKRWFALARNWLENRGVFG